MILKSVAMEIDGIAKILVNEISFNILRIKRNLN